MEKVMRALAETENNAAAIRALQKQLGYSTVRDEIAEHGKKLAELDDIKERLTALEKQHNGLCLNGTYSTAGTFFGKIKTNGAVLAVVQLASSAAGQTATIMFGNSAVYVGSGDPIVCILPAGQGVLLVKSYYDAAVCMLYGDAVKVP